MPETECHRNACTMHRRHGGAWHRRRRTQEVEKRRRVKMPKTHHPSHPTCPTPLVLPACLLLTALGDKVIIITYMKNGREICVCGVVCGGGGGEGAVNAEGMAAGRQVCKKVCVQWQGKEKGKKVWHRGISKKADVTKARSKWPCW